ncbi:hypothetical protein GGR50DRAFT_698967 [Xylaria sp. CBS 124048]|nr:hypothetical protein GGR50DRAFT_698967 [Xylaria sp. CBS 124048]
MDSSSEPRVVHISMGRPEDLKSLLSAIHGDQLLSPPPSWYPKGSFGYILINQPYYDSSRPIDPNDPLLARPAPPYIPERQWRNGILHGLINVLMRVRAKSWFTTTEMVAISALILRERPQIASESSFGSHLSEATGFTRFLSEKVSTPVLARTATVAVFGAVRNAGLNCPHWYMIVVDIKGGISYVLDSLQTDELVDSHLHACNQLAAQWARTITAVDKSLPPPLRVRVLTLATQEDNWSCGLQCAINMVLLFRRPFHASRFTKDLMKGWENQVVEMFEQSVLWKVPYQWIPPRDPLHPPVPRRSALPPSGGEQRLLDSPRSLAPRTPARPKAAVAPTTPARRPRDDRGDDDNVPLTQRRRPNVGSLTTTPRTLLAELTSQIDLSDRPTPPFRASGEAASMSPAGTAQTIESSSSDSQPPQTPSARRPRRPAVSQPPQTPSRRPLRRSDVELPTADAEDDQPLVQSLRRYKPGARYSDIMSLDSRRPANEVRLATEMAQGQIQCPYRWKGETWLQAARRPEPIAPRQWRGWDWYDAQVSAVDRANAVTREAAERHSRRSRGPLVMLDDKGEITRQDKRR